MKKHGYLFLENESEQETMKGTSIVNLVPRAFA